MLFMDKPVNWVFADAELSNPRMYKHRTAAIQHLWELYGYDKRRLYEHMRRDDTANGYYVFEKGGDGVPLALMTHTKPNLTADLARLHFNLRVAKMRGKSAPADAVAAVEALLQTVPDYSHPVAPVAEGAGGVPQANNGAEGGEGREDDANADEELDVSLEQIIRAVQKMSVEERAALKACLE